MTFQPNLNNDIRFAEEFRTQSPKKINITKNRKSSIITITINNNSCCFDSCIPKRFIETKLCPLPGTDAYMHQFLVESCLGEDDSCWGERINTLRRELRVRKLQQPTSLLW